MAPFYGRDWTTSSLQNHYEEAVYFLPQLPEIPGTHFIDLEEWKAESTLGPPSGFEHETLGLRIQRLNHYAIAPYNADVHYCVYPWVKHGVHWYES